MDVPPRSDPPGPTPAPADGTTRSLARLALAAMTIGAALVHLWASGRIGHPSVVFDETGYLGNARWLARSGSGWEMPRSPRYGLGYPLVIAPVTRLFSDASEQWRAILVVNAVLLAAVVPLVYVVTRRVLVAARGPALLAAGVGALVPAVVAAGVSAIAENLVLPLVPLSVLAVYEMARTRRGPTRYLFGPCVALLYATHARFAVAVVIAVVVLGVALWWRAAPRLVLAVNAGLLSVGTLIAWALTRTVEAARWDHVERLEGGPEEVQALVTSREGLSELAWTAVGQAWYLAAGSLGLSVVGLVALAHRLRRATPDAGTSAPPPEKAEASGEGEIGAPGALIGEEGATSRNASGTSDDDEARARRLAIGFLLGTAAGVFAVSVVFFAQNQFRADHLVYGRHNDSFTPLWVAAGVLALGEAGRRGVLRLGAVAATVTAALFGVLALTRDAGAFGGRYSAFAVPAVIRFVGDDPPGTLWRATIAALVGGAAVVAAVAIGRRPILVAPVVVAWFAWAGFGTVGATDSYENVIYASWDLPADVRRLDVTGVSIDVRAADGAFPALSYPFHLPEVRFTTFDPAVGEGPDQPFALARTNDARRPAEGDRIALIDESGYYPFWGAPGGVALWARPGPEHDRLDAAGWLLPVGFPTGLPAEARRAELAIVDGGGAVGREIEVAPGDAAEVEVRGRHAGSGSPWPGNSRFTGPERVRVIAQVEAEDEANPSGARSGGEVPGWILPGDDFEASASVFALDQQLGPLPPGRYRVSLGIGQDQPSWFASGGEDATFTMVVRE